MKVLRNEEVGNDDPTEIRGVVRDKHVRALYQAFSSYSLVSQIPIG